MPRYAIINSGIVENVAIYASQPTIAGRTVVQSDTAGPGDAYNGSTFTPRTPSARELLQAAAPDNIRQSYATLRTWATQAHNASSTYAGQGAAAQAATVATTLDRLGTFMDRVADLLVKLDLDQ